MKSKSARFALLFAGLLLLGAFCTWIGYSYATNDANFLEAQAPFTVSGEFAGVDVSSYTEAFTKYDYTSTLKLYDGEYTTSHIVGGAWNGPLPKKHTHVTISSPTGFMKDVIITTDDGTVYTCQGLCRYPQNQLFDYRVTHRETLEVVCEGTTSAKDDWDAMKSTRCDDATLWDLADVSQPYHVQMWASDEPAPPYITK